VKAKLNILIAGGTGAGKTTMLRALADEIDRDEVLVTVEDAFELGLFDERRHPWVEELQAREANAEGAGRVTQAELVRLGLRRSPDRVIVGEVRGDETVPMLLAMSQGNNGSLSTMHAEDVATVFERLGIYALLAPERASELAIARLTARAVDLVVHLVETEDGRRVISEIAEVTGADGDRVVSNALYRPGRDQMAVRAVPPSTALADRLAAAGFDPYSPADEDRWR
jgi:Flp pilus assembly CpaF family ATPase